MPTPTQSDNIVPKSSNGAGWYVAVGLVVIYVLSIGPVAGWAERSGLPYDGNLGRALEAFYSPLGWLIDNTAAEHVFDWYIELWI